MPSQMGREGGSLAWGGGTVTRVGFWRQVKERAKRICWQTRWAGRAAGGAGRHEGFSESSWRDSAGPADGRGGRGGGMLNVTGFWAIQC